MRELGENADRSISLVMLPGAGIISYLEAKNCSFLQAEPHLLIRDWALALLKESKGLLVEVFGAE